MTVADLLALEFVSRSGRCYSLTVARPPLRSIHDLGLGFLGFHGHPVAHEAILDDVDFGLNVIFTHNSHRKGREPQATHRCSWPTVSVGVIRVVVIGITQRLHGLAVLAPVLVGFP